MQIKEFTIGNQKFEIRTEETQQHLDAVTQIVEEKLSRYLQKKLSLQKAALLVAFEVTSQALKEKEHFKDFQTQVSERCDTILNLL